MFIPLLVAILAFGPVNSFTVHGVVKDDNGTIIPYATITEKGTRNSVAADAKGGFTIQVLSEKSILVINAVGYASKEIKLKGRSSINVALNAAVAQLEEVVVTGYTTTRKKDITGSVSSTYPMPQGFLSNSLAGKVAGVQVNAHDQHYADNNDGYYDDDSVEVFNTEEYDKIIENPFLRVTNNPFPRSLLM